MNAYAEAEKYFTVNESKDGLEQMHELMMMESRILAENKTLLTRLTELRGEAERFDADITFLNDYIASCEEELERGTRNIKEQENKKSGLVELINSIQLRIRTVHSDETSGFSMKKLLDEELLDLITERDMIASKLEGLKNGIKNIELNKQSVMPFGKKQDDMLKQARILLKEAQNRMELSILLKK
ncbi:MAG: hypothetical protein HQK81_12445 [Desulfovibrionaceae bacterium]|nr:hypothetical protein [Desulfovibrionaceae bacterium]MBF0514853.1 hypothetical protein [Desulfovibrionaceae bacterium]